MARVGGEEIDLTPTDGMAKEAQRGLDWRKDGHDGGTSVGLARARQLVNKQELSPSTVRRMHSFFSRHEVDKQGEGFSPGEPGFPSNGRVAWALWGGDAGQTWARAKSETLDRLENKNIDYTVEFLDDLLDDDDEDDSDGEDINKPRYTGKSMQKIFKLDSSIKAIEEDDVELKIAGYASTDALDRSSDKILATAWTKGGLRNFQNNPILLFNHDYNKPIGKVVEVNTDARGLKIKGVISKSAGDVYNLVKEGVLSTFSVGFLIKDADYDKAADGLIVKDAELLEVSVVSVPCNQDATFSVAKSFDNQEDYLHFKQQFVENALGGQPSAETGGSSEGAETASRKFKMDENTQDLINKAVADALAAKVKADEEKAAKEAAEKAAAEAMEKRVAEATAKVLATSEERIAAELEKRFQDKEVNLTTALEGLRSELAEKSAEIAAITNSKRVFSDRGNSTEWKKTFARDMEDAYLLARITKKGYDTDFAKQLIEKVNAHSSVQVSSADFEQEVSTNIERDIQNELILAPMFREIAMNTASMIIPIMPDSGYAEITSAAGSTDGAAPNGTLDTRGGTNRGGIALSEIGTCLS